VPKTINHVVFAVKDYWATFRFFRDRLHFRLSDHQKGIGTYVRPDGAFEHHTMFFLDCNLPGAGGRPGFNHACFGVEDIDEMMVGTHHMLRKGWQTGWMGSGRHRIASALFSYLKCPAGGEAEYGADTDYIDDSWMPREWEYVFGTVMWAHAHEPLMKDEPSWDVGYYRPTGPARTG
jgi:catechol 2,3-dioxygenase-like lactoylglutathione lyase family enzyme